MSDNQQPVAPAPFEQLMEKLADAKSVRELFTTEVEIAFSREKSSKQRAIMESDLREIAKRGNFTRDFSSVFTAFKKDLDDVEKKARAVRREAHAAQNNINFDYLSNPYPDLCSFTYDINDDGVFLDGEQVCTQPVMIFGTFQNVENSEISFCLTFWDGRRWRTLTERREVLFSTAKVVQLASYGLSVHGENARRFVRFLDVFEAENRAYLAPKLAFSRLGWFGKDQFAPYEPGLVFSGKENQDLYDSVKEAGSAEQWITYMQELRKNLPLRLAMAASFASPLLKKAGINPFVFHLWGLSGCGKTVALMASASVWGDPDSCGLLKSLNGTKNYAANLAAFFCSVPVFLDELQTVSRNDWSSIETLVMALTEGIERGRMRYDEARPARKWDCCFLLSGEEPIVKENSKAGFFNRVIEVECTEPLILDGNETANFVRANYGHAGKIYIDHIKTRVKDIPGLFRQQQEEIFGQIETTGKQSSAMAAMMLADRLAGECLFPGETPLTVQDVRPYLRETKDVDNSQRAYDYICGMIAANRVHFDSDPTRNIELWGKVEGRECTFNKVKLVECLKDDGFDFDAVKKGWFKAGVLKKNSQGRFLHDASYCGVKALSTKLILPDFHEDSDDDMPL